jgi:ATP-dependent DNA helicase RecG
LQNIALKHCRKNTLIEKKKIKCPNNIEYKQSRHDDYLKCLPDAGGGLWFCQPACRQAGAQGGIIFIGKDDNGNVVGVAGYKKLMDEIPNKVKDVMGILVDVNLHEVNGLYYLEIVKLLMKDS